MKKYAVLLSLAVVLTLMLSACTSDKMPQADDNSFRDYITKQNSYKNWATFPGTSMMYEGTKPHGAILTTYVNDAALKSIKAKNGMANNSMIVKENYSPDKKLMAITAMYKVNGYNPDGGDWFWVKYTADFKTEKSGKVKGCVNCHGKKKDNDYIFLDKVTQKGEAAAKSAPGYGSPGYGKPEKGTPGDK